MDVGRSIFLAVETQAMRRITFVCALTISLLGAFSMSAQPSDYVKTFIIETETELDRLNRAAALAEWDADTEVSPEHDQASIKAVQAYDNELLMRANVARSLDAQDEESRRKLLLLKLSSDGIIADPLLSERQKRLLVGMTNNYSAACPQIDQGKECKQREKLEAELLQSRDADRLRQLWTSWYDTARPLKDLYAEYVELSNRGARGSGYADAAEMSKAAYEVEPAAFSRDLDALWHELRPLYQLLHAYVRSKLVARYGAQEVDPDGPIPIHLLGNLWGQDWEGIYDIVGVPGSSPDYGKLLRDKRLRADDFVSYAERFFVSLGFPPLPAGFRQRSHVERPRPNFNCHPSARLMAPDDWRLKMCIEIDWANFITAHHEMGHIFYYQSFSSLSYLFRAAPNAGINEAIGDVVALSLTPDYLHRIGLLDSDDLAGLDQLLRVALRKLVRIPFGLMLQKWRWGVQSGAISPERYNQSWWALVREYQGLAPPQPRPTDAFDPGAKQHIAADIDYIRYFLADVVTFQIHAGLSREAGCSLPIHQCSIYESTSAGKLLRTAMSIGASRPWPEVLKVMTGETRVRGEPIRHYLAPLERWLETETQHVTVGW